MKLYWKIYLVLAATTLVTLVLSIWISFTVLPAHYERLRIERLDLFEQSVMNLQDPTESEIENLADSMDIALRILRNSEHPPMGRGPGPGPVPEEDREWRGVRVIQPFGTDFSIVASGRTRPPRLFLLILFALGLFVSQAIALALGLRSVFSRISTLNRVTGEFGEGNLSTRYPPSTGNDEIEKLGSSFNVMAERIITLLASHNELLNAVAHELRTPMARLGFALELARENPQAVKAKLGLMEQDLFELDRLVSELLEFNRIGSKASLAIENVSLEALCLEAADGERTPNSDVKISVIPTDKDSTVSGDHRLLQRAISNLIRNSVCYAQNLVTVEITVHDRKVDVSITDDGPGFPPGYVDRAVNPFVKGHDSKGSGLGLSIVSRIAERHAGKLVLSNSKDGGAKAVISIPR